MNLKNAKTYVYIDVSNIRYACLRSLKFSLDFVKLYNYFRNKYPKLQDVRYYEGIARYDGKKKKHFEYLRDEVGYTICPLERKSYVADAKFKEFRCRKCGTLNKVKILSRAAKTRGAIHIILLACDGDYVEAIKNVLDVNPKAFVTVLATPLIKINNRLSIRLVELAKELGMDKIALTNIDIIKDFIRIEE